MAARRVSAICHQNPDADTLGAAIAVAMIAERLGKEAEIVSGDPPAAHLSFLPWFDRVRSTPRLAPDVAIVLDAATLERTGRAAAECAVSASLTEPDPRAAGSWASSWTNWLLGLLAAGPQRGTAMLLAVTVNLGLFAFSRRS